MCYRPSKFQGLSSIVSKVSYCRWSNLYLFWGLSWWVPSYYSSNSGACVSLENHCSVWNIASFLGFLTRRIRMFPWLLNMDKESSDQRREPVPSNSVFLACSVVGWQSCSHYPGKSVPWAGATWNKCMPGDVWSGCLMATSEHLRRWLLFLALLHGPLRVEGLLGPTWGFGQNWHGMPELCADVIPNKIFLPDPDQTLLEMVSVYWRKFSSLPAS